MNTMAGIWGIISRMGTREDYPEHLNRKLILGNRISAIAGLLVFVLSFFYLNIPGQFLIYIGGALLCGLFILFNAFGLIRFSRIFFMFSIPLLVAGSGSQAPDSIHMIQKMSIISSITIPVVLFGITEKVWMGIGLGWTILCFLLFDYFSEVIPSAPDMVLMHYNPLVAEISGEIITFSVFVISFIYLQKLNLEAENKLKDLLAQSKCQKQEIENQKSQLEIHNRELNIRALSAQMNPHFLYNSLNSIQHFLTVNDKTSSLNYLSKFGRLIRQFVDYSDKGWIPLADELKLLKYYLELESLRFDSMFRYTLNYEEDLLLYNIKVPLLLIQTHVENAILHGLIGKAGNRELDITFTQEEEIMLCVIQDNGIGREASRVINRNKANYHKSHGVELSTKRLTLMYEDLDQTQLIRSIDLYSEKGYPAGTRVEIRIPIEYDL